MGGVWTNKTLLINLGTGQTLAYVMNTHKAVLTRGLNISQSLPFSMIVLATLKYGGVCMCACVCVYVTFTNSHNYGYAFTYCFLLLEEEDDRVEKKQWGSMALVSSLCSIQRLWKS